MKMSFAFVGVAVLTAATTLLFENGTGSNSDLFPSSPPAKQTCKVAIAPWFASGSVSKNGAVLPADSLNFNDASNCNFYKWSWQNFLWLTTPTGKDGGLVLNSAPFFDLDLVSGLLSDDAALATRVEKTDSVKEATGNAYVWGEGNSLIYFGIHTNDVWAYFEVLNTGGKITPAATQFPTDQSALNAIVTGAKKVYGTTIKDGKTLAIEIKTAWVSADLVPNISDYITITSDIPVYDKTDKSVWKTTGKQQKVTLAMVGIHVVGSVKGHKEMVWASFEHKDNAPNDAFKYTGTDGVSHSYSNFDASGVTTRDWLFMPKGTSKSSVPLSAGAIVANNTADAAGTVTASPAGAKIVGQNVFRQSPWGTGAAQPTAPAESNTANNTDIISINQNVLGQLASGDARGNYFLIGATWANNIVPGNSGSVTKGSLTLANTTMETFAQNTDCFACHRGTSLGVNNLSHIYGKVKKFEK